jgi:hypothetical protein
MYNIKKRTHPILSWSILFKFCFFWACALVNCFFYTFSLPWYYIFFTGTFYLFSLSPSLPQAIYFLSALQNKVKDYIWFQNLGVTLKCMTMSGIFLTIPLLMVAFVFIQKGLLFFFLLSLPVLYQFVHSCHRRQYSFTSVLLYDLMLTIVLSGVALFLPSLNFTLLTWKQGILFWNFYLGVLIFGFLLSSKIIKMEVV